MPIHPDQRHGDIKNLVNAYDKLYFWQKWIFPAKLKQVITSSDATDFMIYKSFAYNELWFFQRWFIRCLSEFNRSGLMHCCQSRELAPLFVGEAGQANFDVITQHAAPEKVAMALRALNDAGLLTGEDGHANREAIRELKNRRPTGIVEEIFRRSGLLPSKIFTKVPLINNIANFLRPKAQLDLFHTSAMPSIYQGVAASWSQEHSRLFNSGLPFFKPPLVKKDPQNDDEKERTTLWNAEVTKHTQLLAILFHPVHGLKEPSFSKVSTVLERYEQLNLQYINEIEQAIAASKEGDTLVRFVTVLLAQGNINAAIKTIDAIQDPVYKAKAQIAFFKVQRTPESLEAVRKTIEVIDKTKFNDPFTSSLHSFSQAEVQYSLACELIKQQDIDGANKAIKAISYLHFVAYAQTDLFRAQRTQKNFEAAIKAIEAIPLPVCKINAYIALYRAQPTKENIDAGRKFFEGRSLAYYEALILIELFEARDAKVNFEAVTKTIEAINDANVTGDERFESKYKNNAQRAFLRTLLEQGNIDAARRLIKVIEDPGSKAEALVELLESVLAQKKIETVNQITEAAREIIKEIEPVKQQELAQIKLLKKFMLNGHISDARAIIDKLTNKDIRAKAWIEFFYLLFGKTSSIKFFAAPQATMQTPSLSAQLNPLNSP